MLNVPIGYNDINLNDDKLKLDILKIKDLKTINRDRKNSK